MRKKNRSENVCWSSRAKSRQELKEEAVASWEEISIEEHMEIYEKQGMSRKDAMKQVAKDRGVSKKTYIAI